MKTLHQTSSKHVNFAIRQCGASLLEGIAYLGIAAIVILGAVSLLMGAFSGAETNRVVEEVTAIRTSVKKLYMGQSASYGTTSLNTNLIAAKAFPTTLAANAGTGAVTNAWNGAVVVTGVTSQFTVSYASVPKDVCINAVSASSGWAKVKVGAAAERDAFPVSPTDASTDCSTNSNTIVWTGN